MKMGTSIGEEYIKNTYKILDVIGEGGNGIVYKAYHKFLKKFVAIKVVKNCNGIMSREPFVMKELKYKFIPLVYDYIETGDKQYIIMEYINGTNLANIVNEGKNFNKKTIKKWKRQLQETIKYLHSRTIPIIHGDIKLENIVITTENNICLIDFGVSFYKNEWVAYLGKSCCKNDLEILSIKIAMNRLSLPLKKSLGLVSRCIKKQMFKTYINELNDCMDVEGIFDYLLSNRDDILKHKYK